MPRTRPVRARWGLRPVVASLEAPAGTRVRFLVEASNWGSDTASAHLVARSEWPVQVQPDVATLAPTRLHLAAVRVDVPDDAAIGQRVGIHVVLHGGARPISCDLEVVVSGDAPPPAQVVTARPWIRRQP